VKLDIFSELQGAQSVRELDAEVLVRNTIEQARLADELGFGCWWSVEHHSAASFSASSAPEMILAVLSQHTERIRLGTAGILAPFAIHHPVRLAERAAWVDVLSGGRLELGLARSGGAEWETFGVDPDRTRAELRESMRMIPRMWTEDAFKWESELISVPEREIVPKPLQKPHPPLWQTVTGPESCERAGNLGVGMLGAAPFCPLDHLTSAFEAHRRGLESCDPAGAFVNDQRAVFAMVHCGESRQDVIDSGAALAALWFMNEAPSVFRVAREGWVGIMRGVLSDGGANRPLLTEPEPTPSGDDLDDPIHAIALMNRMRAGIPVSSEEALEAVEVFDTAVIGDVEHCRRKLQGFADVGVDRLMCLVQFGPLSQEWVLRGLRTLGEQLVPHYGD
jgi:alkanesulfonate monooxygenase SsuD/methylene tetrahydromethanopterin reductase-like flavin-dependent oxidoreductase (luciferase family)